MSFFLSANWKSALEIVLLDFSDLQEEIQRSEIIKKNHASFIVTLLLTSLITKQWPNGTLQMCQLANLSLRHMYAGFFLVDDKATIETIQKRLWRIQILTSLGISANTTEDIAETLPGTMWIEVCSKPNYDLSSKLLWHDDTRSWAVGMFKYTNGHVYVSFREFTRPS